MEFAGRIDTHLAGAVATVLVTALVSGCGGRTPTAPSAANDPVTVTPPSVAVAYDVIVSGVVEDSARRRLPGITLTVVDGGRAGLTTVTDARGKFQFAETIPYPSTIRATGDGYADQTKSILLIMGTPVTGGLSFVLQSARRMPIALAGKYSVTFFADSSCHLPELVRIRTYSADVSPAGSGYSVTLSGATFLHGWNRLDAFVFEDFVKLMFVAYQAEDGSFGGGIHELVPPDKTLVISGVAEGTAGDQGFDLPLNGEFWFHEYACSSTNNRLVFRRQPATGSRPSMTTRSTGTRKTDLKGILGE